MVESGDKPAAASCPFTGITGGGARTATGTPLAPRGVGAQACRHRRCGLGRVARQTPPAWHSQSRRLPGDKASTCRGGAAPSQQRGDDKGRGKGVPGEVGRGVSGFGRTGKLRHAGFARGRSIAGVVGEDREPRCCLGAPAVSGPVTGGPVTGRGAAAKSGRGEGAEPSAKVGAVFLGPRSSTQPAGAGSGSAPSLCH